MWLSDLRCLFLAHASPVRCNLIVQNSHRKNYQLTNKNPRIVQSDVQCLFIISFMKIILKQKFIVSWFFQWTKCISLAEECFFTILKHSKSFILIYMLKKVILGWWIMVVLSSFLLLLGSIVWVYCWIFYRDMSWGNLQIFLRLVILSIDYNNHLWRCTYS